MIVCLATCLGKCEKIACEDESGNIIKYLLYRLNPTIKKQIELPPSLKGFFLSF